MATLCLGGSSGLAFLGRRFELLLRVLCLNEPQGCSLWIQVCISLGHFWKFPLLGLPCLLTWLPHPKTMSYSVVKLSWSDGGSPSTLTWVLTAYIIRGKSFYWLNISLTLLPHFDIPWNSVILSISYTYCLFCLFNKLFLYRLFLAILRLEIKS